VGEMNHSAGYIHFNRMRATHATVLLGWDLPNGRVSISQEGIQYDLFNVHCNGTAARDVARAG